MNLLNKTLLFFLTGIILVSCGDNNSSMVQLLKAAHMTNLDRVTKLSELKPNQNGDIIVPEGNEVVIDTDLDINNLKVQGSLSCPNSNASFHFKLSSLQVFGKFICGTAEQRFQGNFKISLKESMMLGMMNRSVNVMPQGKLILHGKDLDGTWQKIGGNIHPGQNFSNLTESASWSVGDKVVISSSSFDMNDAETFEIAQIIGNTLKFNSSAEKFHKGTLMNIKGNEIDQRSVIANLTRNIEITSYGVDHESTQLGGHVMVMGGGFAQIDSVSLNKLGRMGELGRYPFHWHLAGNVRGQYIKNSSITGSYQRCVVIHETDEALVKGNVCYNHFAHGYFLEHGSERDNILLDNLALVSKRPPEGKNLLHSEMDGSRGRFQGPASFWISNPKNIVHNNLAAGSDGSGFWMSFVDFEVCDPSNPCKKPNETDTLIFSNNVAHSSKIGITWDGAQPAANEPMASLKNVHYRPTNKAEFQNLIAYKNSEAGLYFRGDAARFTNAILSDNLWSAFFAYSQELKSSIIIGQSENMTEEDLIFLTTYYPEVKKAGIAVYDGPFELNDVKFLNFPSSKTIFNEVDITPIPIISIGGANRFENKTKKLKFSPEPTKRVLMYHGEEDKWSDSPYSQSIRDLDGTLTGIANSVIVPNHMVNFKDSCKEKALWNAFICEDYKTGLFKFMNTAILPKNMNFLFERVSQRVLSYPNFGAIGETFHNKFNTILGIKEIYNLYPYFNFFNAITNTVSVSYQAEGDSNLSPVVFIAGAYDCEIRGPQNVLLPSVNSLNELQASQNATFFSDSRGLYLRLEAYNKTLIHRNSTFSDSRTDQYNITCDDINLEL